MDMKTPDVTPVQIMAFVTSLLACLIAFGLPITSEQSEAILDLMGKVIPIALASDVGIRYGRAKHIARRQE